MTKTHKITGCVNCPHAKKSISGEWLCRKSRPPVIINIIGNLRWEFFPASCPLLKKYNQL